MRYALVSPGGVAVTILEGHPDDWPDLRDAGVLLQVDDAARPGWVLLDGTPAPPAAQQRRVLTPLEFRRRFTAAEQLAITLAASRGLERDDATLQVWLDNLSAARDVDLENPELAAGLALLVGLGLLASERVPELLDTG